MTVRGATGATLAPSHRGTRCLVGPHAMHRMEGVHMRKLILSIATVGALGMAPAPVPADAAVAGRCLDGVIADCNEDFPNTDERLIAIRGWCYMIRSAWCWF